MARSSTGVYSQPANTAAVSSATISSSAFNTLITDVGTEITNSLDRQGRSAMQAALPMGGYTITSLGTPVNSTDATTKAYVDGLQTSVWSTGDCKLTLKAAADAGWVMMDDGTIGTAGSGATTYANALAQPLFTLLWGLSATWVPIYDSSGTLTVRGGTAVTDFNALKRIALPRVLGRALLIAGAGSGLTSHTLSEYGGVEAGVLTPANLPPHVHDVFLNDPGHAHGWGSNRTSSAGGSPGGVPGIFNGSYYDNTETKVTGITVRDTTAGGGNTNRTSPNATGTVAFTGTLNGTITVTAVSSFAGLVVGATVTGTNIPGGTTIASLNPGGSSLTLSQAATGSGTPTITQAAPTMSATPASVMQPWSALNVMIKL